MEKDDQNMKLSVIVAVYNVQQYIRKCLDSIINQTYKNLQIILVDDGSTDNSGKICNEYAATDKRIQVIHKKNEGLISARKAGIVYATGDYTINFDSDDWIEPTAYERVVVNLEKYHPDMLVFGYKKEFDGFWEEYKQGLEEGFYKKEEIWKYFNQCVQSHVFFNQPIDMIQWNKAIKTEILKVHQINCIDSLKKNTDDAVNFPCLLNIESLYCDSSCYYHYCVRKSSVLWKSGVEDYNQFVLLADHLISSYKKGKNKLYMEKEFLLYKLFYHLILDVPEKLLNKYECLYFPQIKKGSNIIVYGKGVFANRFISCIQKYGYYNIVNNIDKMELDKVKKLSDEQYEYLVIAIFNAVIVENVIENLVQLGIKRERIVCIEKKYLTPEKLPNEVRKLWNEL